jgi:hypothetical protein
MVGKMCLKPVQFDVVHLMFVLLLTNNIFCLISASGNCEHSYEECVADTWKSLNPMASEL